jgi:type VI secretion system secreted protein VgrG
MTDLSDIRSAVGAAAQNFADRLLSELGSFGPNQHTRLLRLHTPLGADLLLAERARITEAIGPCTGPTFGIDLIALSTDAGLDPDTLIGQPVLLELLAAQSRTALRPFHGHVMAFELLGADGGYARYRLRIGAWLDFLRHRTDSWVFQGQTVVQITDSILSDYAAQGALQPQWRWALQQPDAYPSLSTLSQYAETDFDFLQRLWAANGLFCWFEHQGDAADTSTLGRHTLVIADHNGAFTPNSQGRIRYTQPGATMKEDSITRWHGVRRIGVSTLCTASFDHRSVTSHAATFDAAPAHQQPMALAHNDQPGAYAYETPEEAARLATVQLQSLEARRKQFRGQGTVRILAPATTFTLADHAEHDLDVSQSGDDAARFAVLSVVHQARNNLSADAQAGLQHLLGHALLGGEHAEPAQAARNDSQEPLYEAHFVAQRAAVPYRASLLDEQGRLLCAKPTAWGTQTAVVVGLDGPVHTDRDGRVKVQFHWQRGAQSSHRQAHTAGDNAPATDASGTWVRVSQDWAGANWGGVFIPRLGQEVIVAFIEGDIDRPVIVGAAYNGQGSADAQGNRIAGGTATATGNAPAWFPGSEHQGALEGHAHTATLSGFKSQSLDASQAGGGAHNQLVFDDTPGQGRVLAHTTQRQTWLQMGHLLQQHGNQRLAHRGHGLELHTQAQGAVRAGSGLHLSTHMRHGGTSGAQGQPTNTREAQAQLQSHAELLQTLGDNARTHRADLPNEPEADKLHARQALRATLSSLQATQSSSDGNGGSDGGQGSIPITGRPDLVLSAAAALSSATPAHTAIAVAQHTTLTSGQDTNLLSQRHIAWAVKDGISLFTRGEAKDGQRTVQDVGMRLHAASGNVNVQAQSDAFMLTTQGAIDLQSTAASITISAPNKIVLNAGGSYLKIEGGDIELGTSGNASFLASMKELAGGGSVASSALTLPGSAALNMPARCSQTINVAALLGRRASDQVIKARLPYRAYDSDGKLLAQGHLDMQGNTQPIYTDLPQKIRITFGDGNWVRSSDTDHGKQ